MLCFHIRNKTHIWEPSLFNSHNEYFSNAIFTFDQPFSPLSINYASSIFSILKLFPIFVAFLAFVLHHWWHEAIFCDIRICVYIWVNDNFVIHTFSRKTCVYLSVCLKLWRKCRFKQHAVVWCWHETIHKFLAPKKRCSFWFHSFSLSWHWFASVCECRTTYGYNVNGAWLNFYTGTIDL